MRVGCLTFVLVLFLVCLTSADKHVLRINVNPLEFPVLVDYLENAPIFDVWKVGENHIDVSVPQNAMGIIESLSHQIDFDYTIMIPSLDEALNKFQEQQARASQLPGFFTAYQNPSAIGKYLQDLVAQYPNLAQMVEIGQTYQGREIVGIQISSASDPENVPKIVYQGCQHAREWISPMTVTYIAEQLLVNSNNPTVANYLKQFQFTLIPVVNADGYNYSIESERLWRKNRRTNQGSSCIGVDLNRNWGFEWGGAGSSGVVCSDTYRGTGPFSEPETQAVSNFISSLSNVQGFIDFHSYGQWWLFPWGYEAEYTPDNVTQSDLADQSVSSIKSVHGKIYTPGNSAILLYPAAGGSDDWTYSTGIIWSYTVELRDTGRYGFLLPPEEIIPTGQEIWAAVQTFAGYILNNIE